MWLLKLHVCPVVYRKDLFWVLYSFSYILTICHKLSNVIFSFMLMIHALPCQHKDIHEIEKQLNKDFESICDWFVDNKISIHFGNEKTKSILLALKFKRKKVRKLNKKYGNIQIKQHSKVKYLGCMLDETMPGETMALSVINKINNKLKYIYRKNRFLTPDLRRLLCNARIQPHFDYACSA